MLKAGKRRIVLNLARMPYIDSSGLMEIAASWTTVRKHGGRLWLCEPSSRIADLLRLTNLVTIFEIVHEDEIAGLASSQPMMAECPICDPPRSFSLAPDTEWYSCGACGLTMTFATPPGGPVEGEPKGRCTRLRIPTYDAEWIDLSVMTREDITIEKRSDLFVFEFVERLWQVLPAPRRVLFSMKYGEATRTGLERLWECLRTLSRREPGRSRDHRHNGREVSTIDKSARRVRGQAEGRSRRGRWRPAFSASTRQSAGEVTDLAMTRRPMMPDAQPPRTDARAGRAREERRERGKVGTARQGAGGCQAAGGAGHRGQERVPGEHEPRDPHAAQRHPRHDRARARDAAVDRAAASTSRP